VNLAHGTVQRVELSTSLATFLQFTLKTAEDVVEGEAALAGWPHATAHATHADEPLWLHRGATLTTNRRPLTVEVERVARTGAGGHVLVVTREGITGWVLGELLLLRMGGSLSFLLVEDAEDTSSNLVVDDGLVVFADNVDAELLIKCGCCVYDVGSGWERLTTMSSDFNSNGSDSKPSPLSLSPLMKVPLELLTSLM
jgi:hypothetical protein